MPRPGTRRGCGPSEPASTAAGAAAAGAALDDGLRLGPGDRERGLRGQRAGADGRRRGAGRTGAVRHRAPRACRRIGRGDGLRRGGREDARAATVAGAVPCADGGRRRQRAAAARAAGAARTVAATAATADDGSRWRGASARAVASGASAAGRDAPCPEHRRGRAPLRRLGRPCPRRRRVTVPVRCGCGPSSDHASTRRRTLRVAAARCTGSRASAAGAGRRVRTVRSAASNPGAHGPWPASTYGDCSTSSYVCGSVTNACAHGPDRVAMALPRVPVAEDVEVQLDRRRLVEARSPSKLIDGGDEIGVGAARRRPTPSRRP